MKKIKALLTLVLMCSVILSEVYTAHADPDITTLATKIEDATNLLEYLLKEEYDEVLDEINKEIKDKGYDLQTSLESIYEKDSIFTGADYLSLMAAYMEITNNKLTIHDIKFISYSCDEEYLTYKIPFKTYEIKKDENGNITKGRTKYISTEGMHEVLVEKDDGSYIVEKKNIKLEEKNIAYGNYTLHLITPEELLQKYGKADTEEKLDILVSAMTRRKELLSTSGVNINGLSESIMLNLVSTDVISEEGKEVLASAIENTTGNTKIILKTASSLLGMVPYLWGGKPNKPGYDTSWWTIDGGKQKGLDCSGYVAWTYLTSGYSSWNNLYSTGSILSTQEYIPQSDLQPGDLGLLNHGETVNHVGIYIGNGYFIHCSSSKGTVIVSQFPFTVFMRVRDVNELSADVDTELNLHKYEITEAEKVLLAQTVSHEAKGQGLNGWIGVLEVIFNRLDSELFPNTVYDIIYAEGQFEGSENIYKEEPSDNIYAAVDAFCAGKIRILNDSTVLYFRNPPDYLEDELEDWGSLKAVTKINDHVFYR